MTSNHPIGLTLSGGGVKGAVHAGMIHYLEEARIEPSIISGTSAGAIVGGLFASGLTGLEILEFFLTERLYSTKLVTGNLGIINTQKLYEVLAKYITNPQFESQKIAIKIAATNMLSGELTVFEKGDMINAILASAAFPGVFKPMLLEGNLYSDGGILNHFPADIIRNECEFLIGMHLSPNKVLSEKDLSSTANILARSIDLQGSGAELHKLDMCNIGMCPKELTNFNTFDFNTDKIKEMFNLGYRYMKQHNKVLMNL